MSETIKNPVILRVRAIKYYPKDYTPSNSVEAKFYERSKWGRNQKTTSSGKKSSSNIVNYFTRDKACDKTTKSPNLKDEEPSGLFGINGDLSKEEKKEVIKKLSSTKSIIWEQTISFAGDIGDIINNRNTAQIVLKNTLPLLLKNNNFDPNKIEWYGVFHNNTKNNHIHFFFFEKEPSNLNKDGKLVYRPNARSSLKESSLQYFKNDIYQWTMEQQNSELIKNRNNLSKLITDDVDDKDILILGMNISNKVLKNIETSSYGKLSKSDKEAVNDFILCIKDKNKEIKSLRNDYYNKIFKIITESKDLNSSAKSARINKLEKRMENALFETIGDEALKLLRIAKDHQLLNEQLFDEKEKTPKVKNKKIYGTSSNVIRHNQIERKRHEQEFYQGLKQVENSIANRIPNLENQEYTALEDQFAKDN